MPHFLLVVDVNLWPEDAGRAWRGRGPQVELTGRRSQLLMQRFSFLCKALNTGRKTNNNNNNNQTTIILLYIVVGGASSAAAGSLR